MGNGSEVETASVEAVKRVEDKILYLGRLVVEQSFNLSEMVETQTPARLRRVWKTTQKFWEEVTSNFRTNVGEVKPRLRIRGNFEPEKKASEKLGDFHTYELKLASVNINLSVTYVKGGEFLTVDNLERTAVLLNPSEKPHYYAAANDIRNRLYAESKSGKLLIEEPTGYGNPNKLLGKLHILDEGITLEQTPYIPAISILTEPQTFMAVVPADKALAVAKDIKKIFEREMGKVHSRLPLTVGIVFAGRRTPLPAILDAGRRMLRQPTEGEQWKVKGIQRYIETPNADSWPDRVELELKKGERILPISVETVMGDKITRDEWYPYWDMEAPIPNKWVHICDLQEGDVVSLKPSRFDFEFLDSAAQRFEVSYEDGKRRDLLAHPRRPYYLEELEDFECLWKILADSKGLTTSQIHNLIGFIETKRMEWVAIQDKSIFERLVRDALDNAEWKTHPRQHLAPKKFEQLCRAGISGQLADVVEVYMRILKIKTAVDKMEEGNQ